MRGHVNEGRSQSDLARRLGEVGSELLRISGFRRAIAGSFTRTRRNGTSPKNAAAFNNRANALPRRRQYDRALQDYEEALRLDPNNALYFRNRGNAYRITGERDRGLSQGAQSETRRRKQKAN
jgi:tetratricopeptide (TPR) repeat protein